MSQTLAEDEYNVKHVFNTLWIERIAKLVDNVNAHKADGALFVTREVGRVFHTFQYRTKFNLRDDVKNNAKARDLLKKGDEMFAPNVARYIEAAKHYNECIAFSKPGSEERAEAYLNRSAVSFKLKRYEDCLVNFRLAHGTNQAARIVNLMKDRERMALDSLAYIISVPPNARRLQKHMNEFPLSSRTRVKTALELRKNDQFGRHVVTNCDLSAGQVVIVEKPFASVLKSYLRCVRCAFCYEERLFTLIPCEGCTVEMYCSQECMGKAYEAYHRYECAILRDMHRISVEYAWVALRTVATAIASFDHNLEAMKEHIERLDESSVNAFGMNWQTATAKDKYNTIHVLSSYQAHRKIYVAFAAFHANVIYHLLIDRTELRPICIVKPELRKLLFDLVLRNLKVAANNATKQNFFSYKVSEQSYRSEPYAHACFSMSSMLNHSCAPNVLKLALRGGRCAVVVLRPIRQGEQLFVSYGDCHKTAPRPARQRSMILFDNFMCKCVACKHNYKTLKQSIDATTNFENSIENRYISHVNNVIDSHDKFLVVSLISELKAYINTFDDDYPTVPLCLAHTAFARAIAVLHSFTSENADYWAFCKP
uniref:SET domain-containing protein n=1 Tax=Anopheles dirus TaxID=7168 RepID=A0A182N1D4_9DIPT